ncbi:MAG: phosphatase PAP2 family protein [Acidobacteriota bacterium]|nr:phosphatase PAP2 family protein [Acidobacteriota bacterium]
MNTLSFRWFALAVALAGPVSSRLAGQATPPDPGQTPAANPIPQSLPGRAASWKSLLPNILDDQKRIWSFPARVAEDRNYIATAAVLGSVAGLIALDPAEGRYFRQSTAYRPFNNAFGGNMTAIGTIVAPLSLYGIGLLRKDTKMTTTAFLAGEAVADSEIVATVLKDATRRVRPASVPLHGNYADTWFESGGSPLSARGGFPSGHTIAAFSIATIVARRYGNHRWVPYAAYGLATAVALSRLTLSAHFLSDVFAGAALGYSISRFEVLRQ